VKEAKKAGVKYIVKQSVMGADAEPEVTPISIRLHRQAEKIIEESKIPFTFLRANFFMQNFVNFYSNSIKMLFMRQLETLRLASLMFVILLRLQYTHLPAITGNMKERHTI
jgi:hypothetical protein